MEVMYGIGQVAKVVLYSFGWPGVF